MAPGRYNFEFYRHTCGRTISIYDTEPCICEQAPKEPEPVNKATPTTKMLLRLLRRAKAHGVQPWHIIRAEKQIIVLFAERHIRIRDDGSMVPDMHPRYTPDREALRVDPQWRNSFDARMHAEHLNWAADCRRHRWLHSAKDAVKMAREDRIRD